MMEKDITKLPVSMRGKVLPGARVISVDFETGRGLVSMGPHGPLVLVDGVRLVNLEKDTGENE